MGMPEEMLLAVLQGEIEKQCDFVLIAYDKLNQTLQDNRLQQAQQRVTEATIHRDQIAQTPDFSMQALDRALEILHQARQDWQTLRDLQSLFISFYIQSLLVAAAN